ncbi:hypothetical protein IHJ17_002396 [Escherichia coli]|nr:hypothetical protein [Escherichia coli]
MSEKFNLQNKRLMDSIEQTLLLLSKSGGELIKAVAKSLVLKIKPYDFVEFKHSAIYRAIRTYNEKRDSVIRLSGLYSPLFGLEKEALKEEPFSLIVNVDEQTFKQGFIWYSPEKDRAFRMEDLSYFVLEQDNYIPFDLSVTNNP